MPGIHVVKLNISDFEPFYCHQCQSHQAKAHQTGLLPVVEIPKYGTSIYGVYAFGCIFSPCILGLVVSFFDLFIKSSEVALRCHFCNSFPANRLYPYHCPQTGSTQD